MCNNKIDEQIFEISTFPLWMIEVNLKELKTKYHKVKDIEFYSSLDS